MADVTLTIGGDASGAVQAAAQAGAALQSIPGGGVAGGWSGLYGEIPAKFAPVGEAFRSVGAATVETTEQFALNRMEAGRLTAVLTQLGVVPPVIGRSLTMMMASALNPMMIGFAVGIVAIQGLISAFHSMGEAAEKERQKIKGLVDEENKLVESLEKVRRLRDAMTPAGAAAAERGRRAVAGAGVSADETTKLLEAAAEAGVPETDLADMAYAWMGRGADVRGDAAKDPEAFVKRFSRQRGGEAFQAMVQRGARRAAQDPGLRERVRTEQARADQVAANKGAMDHARMILAFAEWSGRKPEEAEAVWQRAQAKQTYMTIGTGGFAPEIAAAQGEVRRFVGMEIHYHLGGDEPNPAVNGPARGPVP